MRVLPILDEPWHLLAFNSMSLLRFGRWNLKRAFDLEGLEVTEALPTVAWLAVPFLKSRLETKIHSTLATVVEAFRVELKLLEVVQTRN